MAQSFQGRTSIITGGVSSGIGAGVARRLADEGAALRLFSTGPCWTSPAAARRIHPKEGTRWSPKTSVSCQPPTWPN